MGNSQLRLVFFLKKKIRTDDNDRIGDGDYGGRKQTNNRRKLGCRDGWLFGGGGYIVRCEKAEEQQFCLESELF